MQDEKVSEEDVKRLRAAFNEALDDREDMRDARDEALAERDRYRKALELIGCKCASFTRDSNCVNAGRTRGAQYTADAWCAQCIAREALTLDRPCPDCKGDEPECPTCYGCGAVALNGDCEHGYKAAGGSASCPACEALNGGVG